MTAGSLKFIVVTFMAVTRISNPIENISVNNDSSYLWLAHSKFTSMSIIGSYQLGLTTWKGNNIVLLTLSWFKWWLVQWHPGTVGQWLHLDQGWEENKKIVSEMEIKRHEQ